MKRYRIYFYDQTPSLTGPKSAVVKADWYRYYDSQLVEFLVGDLVVASFRWMAIRGVQEIAAS